MSRTGRLRSILGLSLAVALLFVQDSKNPAPRVSTASSIHANRGQDLPSPEMSAQARLMESYGKLSLSFETNRGQTDSQVTFLSRCPMKQCFLSGLRRNL